MAMSTLRKASLLTILTTGDLLHLNMAFFLSPFLVIAVARLTLVADTQTRHLTRRNHG